MVESKEQQPERLEAAAEAGPGATMENSSQTVSAVDTAKEKEMSHTTGASSEEEASLTAEEKPQEEKKADPPIDPEKARSKAATALIMAALMVWTSVEIIPDYVEWC